MFYDPLILTFSRREKARIVVRLWMLFMSGSHQQLATMRFINGLLKSLSD
jgi:hypothetical protein